MADHKAPDYELDQRMELDEPEQFRALFDRSRGEIVDLLLERAATIKDLSDALGRPKGTIGHHVGVLEDAGLIKVVRTEMVRAIEAKYYGRTARTYVISDHVEGVEFAPDRFLTEAVTEFAEARDRDLPSLSTLRHVRIPDERADEWVKRLQDLTEEFTGEARGGDTTYGLLVAVYPTNRPHLADAGARD